MARTLRLAGGTLTQEEIRMKPPSLTKLAVPALIAATIAACGDSGSSNPTGAPPGLPNTEPNTEPNAGACDAGRSFDGTFAGIQEVIFERHGCTAEQCHGSAAQGGLELSSAVAYANLVEVDSQGSTLARILPGDHRRSFLWLKLAAKLDPDSFEVSGAPMPSGLPAVSEDDLELLRLWIYGGAPEHETVLGTADYLDACLPPAEPVTIAPLPPPPPGEGVQFVMPPWTLPAGSEHEVCFASYYDVSDQIPAEFLDESGSFFYTDTSELRQDPQSHHLILDYAFVPIDDIRHPSFGAWTCKGGATDGAPCEPLDLDSCGDGLCATEPQRTFGCLDYGPVGGGPGVSYEPIGGAQEAQSRVDLYPGVYGQVPVRGILYWNSHAFNLTASDHRMNGRLNFMFAKDRVYPAVGIFDLSALFAPNAAPFTKEVECNDHVLPQGARLYSLTSHTHKRGELFWIDLADGTRLYENTLYNDPIEQRFDPPLAFDSPDASDRTLTYCARYNNGVAPDGSPDPETVTRRSRTPQSAIAPCEPVACAEGAIGRPCAGVGDDATCDSSPGAGDGFCDACPITGGESTENEMFLLIGDYFIEPAAAS